MRQEWYIPFPWQDLRQPRNKCPKLQLCGNLYPSLLNMNSNIQD